MDTPYLEDITPEQVMHFGGGGITLAHLEKIIEVTNRTGKVVLVYVGPTSILDMVIGLIDYASKIKEAKRVIEEVKHGA